MKTQWIFVLCTLLCSAFRAEAQQWSLSTNAVDYLNLGALNGELSVALSHHCSLSAAAAYNPWQFGSDPRKTVQNRQRRFSVGMRYWPWQTFSGWWFSFKGQYREYNRSGLSGEQTAEEGDALGAGLSFGYALMLTRKLNLDFGVGTWAGRSAYTVYACPHCGRILQSGHKGFLKPNDLQASITYVF